MEEQLTGIYLRNIDLLDDDFFLHFPSIDGYLVDKSSGKSTKADSSDTNIYNYICPYTFNNNTRCIDQNLNKLLVIESNFDELKSENKILLFEICKRVKNNKTKEYEQRRIAWAFLLPLASDGSMNTNQDLKLQLYKIRKKCKVNHQECNIFHLYSEHKLKKLYGTLKVSVKGIVPRTNEKSKENEEPQNITETSEKKLSLELPAFPKPTSKTWKWSRLPSQSCRIPNKIHQTYSFGKHGVSCMQFSKSGIYIAVAVSIQIYIYEVLPFEKIITLKGHNGYIYEIDWCVNDEYLLSVCNDCRGIIWSLSQTSPLFVLPHPSYIYCGKWISENEEIITGGKDHILRYWKKNEENFDLIEEIPGHPGFITSLAVQDSSLILSGDSQGYITIHEFSEGNLNLIKQLSFSEIGQKVIDSIHVHHSRRRIIISVRSKGSYLVDVASGIILQTYKLVTNTIARCISCLTPCGSFLFSFSQNGDVGVWEVNTGKLVATYDNLFPLDRLTELSGFIVFHPYEHMVGITALGNNPLMILKYDLAVKNDSKKIGLSYKDKKEENWLMDNHLIRKNSLNELFNKDHFC